MFHSDDDIYYIGESLCARTLPKAEWTHAAHVAAAVWMLDQYGLAQAELRMPDIIRTYNEATGVSNTDQEGYHDTITIASLRVIAAKSGEGSLVERVNRLLANGFDRPGWLMVHYSRDNLFSVKARRHWVDPDLKPLH